MRPISISLFIISLFLTSCNTNSSKKEMAMGNLTISDATPQPGETITISYNGEEELDDPYYYELVGTDAYPYDLEFDEQNKVKINLSDSASAIVLAMKTGEESFDTNDEKGYFIPLDEKGELALSCFRLKNKDEFGATIDKAKEFAAIKKDYLSENPKIEYKGSIFWWARERGDKEFINKYMSDLESINNKESSLYLYSFYKRLGNEAKADSVYEVIKEKYPQNDIFSYELIEKYREEKAADKKAEIFKTYTTQYPEGNYEKFYDLINKMDSSSKASQLYFSAVDLVEQEKDLDMAEKMCKEAMTLMDDVIASPEKRSDFYKSFYSPNQFIKNQESYKQRYINTYATIQYKKGDLNEAIKYLKMAVADGENDRINEKYIGYLTEADMQEEIVAVAPNFIEKGKASSKVIDAFRTAYAKVNPDKNDAESIIASKKTVARKKLTEEIEKQLINKPAPNFTLKDMNGNMVSLSDYKGKTVVVDFWATWCGPCVASFPAMQEVVNANKDNDNTAFLFINTNESGETREQDVSQFIKGKNYTFDVLYDTENKETERFDVAMAYGVNGIPTKFFIDPEGNIRFKGVGFRSTEKTKQEAEILLDILGSHK